MMADMQIPEAFAPLLTERWRYKFYYGGRGGGKSYAFADSLVLLGAQKKIFVACLREIQDSIKDSVYKLLKERIINCPVTGFMKTGSTTLKPAAGLFSKGCATKTARTSSRWKA